MCGWLCLQIGWPGRRDLLRDRPAGRRATTSGRQRRLLSPDASWPDGPAWLTRGRRQSWSAGRGHTVDRGNATRGYLTTRHTAEGSWPTRVVTSGSPAKTHLGSRVVVMEYLS